MAFFDFLKGRKPPAREPPSFYVARNEAGEPIYSDDIVSELLNELEMRRSARAPYELQWQLNADFIAGNQNVDVDFTGNCLKLDTFADDRVKERRVFNRISPLMDTRLANLMSVGYEMFVKPRTGEAEDAAKAKIGTKLLEYCMANVGFRDQMNQLLQWSEICGTAFTVSYWDKNAGDVIAEMAVAEDGAETKPMPIHLGDLAFGILSPYEVFPASLTVQNVADQHDIITEQVFDTDEVRDIWGITVEGDTVDSYVITPEPKGVSGHGQQNATFGVTRSTRENAVRVVTYYEKPTILHPKGRLIVIVKDRIVFHGELPAGVMPIVAYKAKEVPGWFFGKSVIESLIPLQRSYNEIQNKIMDYVHVIVNAPLLTPVGSLDMSEIESMGGIAAGDIIEYDPARGGKPEYMQYAPFSPLLTAQRDQLAQDMEYTAGVSQLMVYGHAANSASGAALNTRREIDMTRMSLTADNIRDGVIQTAKIWLMINKAYSTGYRTVLISGDDDMAGIVTWCADDINSYDVEFTAENELRHSRDQQREDFVTALKMGLFTNDDGTINKDVKRKAWELFKTGNMEDVLDLEDQQRKNARYEITLFQSGAIPPEDKYADDEVHLEEHLRFALSNDYRMMSKNSPNWAAQYDQHIAEHRAKIAAKEQQKQAQAMRMQMMMNGSQAGR